MTRAIPPPARNALAAAIERAGFPPGEREGERSWVLEQLSVAFLVYQGLAGKRAHAIPRKELDGTIESAKRLITHLRTLPIDVQASPSATRGTL